MTDLLGGVVRPVLAPPCWPNSHAPNPETGRCSRCGTPSTCYDRYADWYEHRMSQEQPHMLADVVSLVVRLAPSPPVADPWAVDLCCGPGLVSAQLGEHGWNVTGVDASPEMVSRARLRLPDVRHCPVGETHLPAASAWLVLSTLSHTDAPWRAIVDEAFRLLRPGGTFVYVGTHPAFVGPHADRQPDGGLRVYPDLYGDEEWHRDAPGYSAGGMRAKVGSIHLSLARLCAPLLDRRWTDVEMIEGSRMPLPAHIGFRAVRR